jgi:hypothetical protein
MALPSIESIYQASRLDVKLSCLLHLYGHLPTVTASMSFWTQRQLFRWLQYQQFEHDSAIRVKLPKRSETIGPYFVVFTTDIVTATK